MEHERAHLLAHDGRPMHVAIGMLRGDLTTNPREARDGVLGSSNALAIVNHPRAARPRGARWSPRGPSPRGANPMPGTTGVIRPRTQRVAPFVENG